MARGTAQVVGVAAVALGAAAAATAVAASTDGSPNPAAEAVADLPRVTDFAVDVEGGGCVFDRDRGGLVLENVSVTSKSTGVLELSFYAQRDSLDDVLPGYVSTILTFDDDSRSHTLDLVVPVTVGDYEAGYDECRWHAGNS